MSYKLDWPSLIGYEISKSPKIRDFSRDYPRFGACLVLSKLYGEGVFRGKGPSEPALPEEVERGPRKLPKSNTLCFPFLGFLILVYWGNSSFNPLTNLFLSVSHFPFLCLFLLEEACFSEKEYGEMYIKTIFIVLYLSNMVENVILPRKNKMLHFLLQFCEIYNFPDLALNSGNAGIHPGREILVNIFIMTEIIKEFRPSSFIP